MISSTELVRLLRDANLRSYVIIERPAGSAMAWRLTESGLAVCHFTPMAESAPSARRKLEQAIREFRQKPEQVLLIGEFAVVKSLEAALEATQSASSLYGIQVFVRSEDGSSLSATAGTASARVIREIGDMTGSVIYVRHQLPLYSAYLDSLVGGEKVTTVRFRPGAIEIPAGTSIPVYETEDFGQSDRSEPSAMVTVSGLSYMRYADLTEADARRDGFTDLAEMRHALATIYQDIGEEAWLTVYDIALVPDSGRQP